MKCNHKTAMVISKRKTYTHMLCTDRCRQPYVMAKGDDGRYTEQPDVVQFFVEQEQRDETKVNA